MWPAKPSARLPALLLLALALSPLGTQGRPRGRRALRLAEFKSQPFLPVTGTRQAPRASRSAGKRAALPPYSFLLFTTFVAGQAPVGKAELSTAEGGHL